MFRTNIYFIQAASGPIKIGHSGDVRRRLGRLRVSTHETLTLIGVVEDATPSLERHLHRGLGDHRIRGEWFEPHQDVIAAIEGLTSGDPVAKARVIGDLMDAA